MSEGYHDDRLLLPQNEEPWPMAAHVCERCGACVVDTAVHDRFHEQLTQLPYSGSTVAGA